MIKIITIVLLLCTACSSSIQHQYKGTYRIGATYTINEETYYPQHYDKYEEMGVASWYNEECNKCSTHDECKSCVTANGELFNKDHLTAAHRTLPMPSMVKVTNLDNGKSIKLKINDRGPFKNDRILDVTEKVAEKLDFKEQGLAMVRVEYLKRSTEKLIHSKLHYKKPYRRIMDDINKRRSIFTQNVKKINETFDSHSPDKKRVERTIKYSSPQAKKEAYIQAKYNISTKYKKSTRYRRFA